MAGVSLRSVWNHRQSATLFTWSGSFNSTDTHYGHIHFSLSHTPNALLSKFRCNIFICVTIIKEMPGSVASGTQCTWCIGQLFELLILQQIPVWQSLNIPTLQPPFFFSLLLLLCFTFTFSMILKDIALLLGYFPSTQPLPLQPLTSVRRIFLLRLFRRL